MSRSVLNGHPELVRDAINGVCHQRFEKRFEQQESEPNVHAEEENLEEQLLYN